MDSGEFSVSKAATVQIVGGLDLKEVCSKEGAIFTINSDDKDSAAFSDDEDNDTREEDSSSHDDDKFYNLETQRDTRFLPIDAPFEEMMLHLENVDKEEMIKKKIIKPGIGSVVNPSASVQIHYQSYLDGVVEPFDSSRLRKQRQYFKLGEGEVFPGLDEAVATMRVRELSRFFIKWPKAYGMYGQPPRIPKEANIMMEIELLATSEVSESIADPLEPASPFAKAMAKAKEAHYKGNELFRTGRNREAIRQYHLALKYCLSLRLQDATEEEEMLDRKVKLHVNLAICYNKENKPEQACAQSREVLSLKPTNHKALYNLGRAHLKLSNFRNASEYLNRALKLKPNDKAVIGALAELDKKEKTQGNEEKEFCKRFMKM